jgi:hypothetical protein
MMSILVAYSLTGMVSSLDAQGKSRDFEIEPTSIKPEIVPR